MKKRIIATFLSVMMAASVLVGCGSDNKEEKQEEKTAWQDPFIDPGSVYDGNVWDWDTYWSVYGFFNLADSYPDDTTKARLIEHAKGNIHNFMDHQLPDGYIPMMIEVADWPEPYLNMKHKEGILMNMHKPFLCQQIVLISDFIGDYSWCSQYFENLEKYFECYDENYYFENFGLYAE